MNSDCLAVVTDTRASRMRRMSQGVITGCRGHFEDLGGSQIKVKKPGRQAQPGRQARAVMQIRTDDGLRYKPLFITCTYRDNAEPSPRDISRCISTARKWCKRRGVTLRYVWVAELTKRGRLHYHLLLFLPWGIRLPNLDDAGWWPHGWTKIEWARSPLKYLSKYASKGQDTAHHKYPKGFRIHGTGGLSEATAARRTYERRPQWVKDLFSLDDRPKPAPGGGYVSVQGEWHPSPWRIVHVEGHHVQMVRIDLLQGVKHANAA